MNARAYSGLEIFFFAFGAMLLALGISLMVLKIPVGQYLFGWVDRFELQQVATTGQLQGTARRKVATQSDFSQLESSGVLYNYDTIVTEPDSSATVLLNDGGKIELGPRTMIKLEITDRQAKVQVVAGAAKVKSTKKPIVLAPARAPIASEPLTSSEIAIVRPIETIAAPIVQAAVPVEIKPIIVPSPLPVKSPVPPSKKPEILQFTAASLGTSVKLHTSASLEAVPLGLSWKKTASPTPVEVSLKHIKSGTTQSVQTVDLARSDHLAVPVNRPGVYEWTISRDKKPVFRAKAEVPQKVEGLVQILEPLIAGQKTRSSEYNGVVLKDLELTLRWKSNVSLKNYRIRFFKKPGDKPYHEANLPGESYVLKKTNVASGKIFYQVDGIVKAGFWIVSPLVPFQFDYVPPIPMNPQSKQVISIAELDNQSLLFTWRRTNFTEYYELEVATDIDFDRMTHRFKTKENYFTTGALKPGHYFWRVRSFANGVYSPATPGSEFTLK